jgi:electron transfer flavoprotein beta subunit
VNAPDHIRLLVAIKQVLEPETRLQVDDSGRAAGPDGPATYWLNRLDEFALEAAVRIKESRPGVEMDAATVGPARAAKVLERAVGMGADRAIHVLTADDPGTTVIAAALAGLAQNRNYDLILTGAMSEDQMNGQVGPALAALLDLPWATLVMALDLLPAGREIIVEREIEGGRRHRLALDLPALITVQSGINKPRYPSLSNVLRAKKTPPETILSEKLIDRTEPTETLSLTPPARKRAGQVLAGDTRAKAEQLRKILADKGFL